MKLKDIIGVVGSVASFVHPAIGAAITGVNKLIPDGEEKLPSTATPQEIHDKIASLPPEVQAQAYEMECEVQIAEITSEVDRIRALAAVDQQSTRPKIAMLMAYAVCWLIVLYTGIIIYAIKTATDMSQWWPLFGVIIAVPAEVLRNYFGNLRKEQGNRLQIPQKNLLDIIRGK